MKERKAILSTLWIFLTANFIYCDILDNMQQGIVKDLLAGYFGAIPITQGFLLGVSILLEIPISMILLSRILKYKINRIANIAAGFIMTAAQVISLVLPGGTPPIHYIFYSVIEIACAVFIMWYAWKWTETINMGETK